MSELHMELLKKANCNISILKMSIKMRLYCVKMHFWMHHAQTLVNQSLSSPVFALFMQHTGFKPSHCWSALIWEHKLKVLFRKDLFVFHDSIPYEKILIDVNKKYDHFLSIIFAVTVKEKHFLPGFTRLNSPPAWSSLTPASFN